MTDDFKKGLVTGLAMHPLCVTSSANRYCTNGLEIAEGIAAKLLPIKIMIAKEVSK